jgi:DNA-binding response OmpR family regulator
MQDLHIHLAKDAILKSRLLIAVDDAYLGATLRQQFAAEGFTNIFEIGFFADLETILDRVNTDLILLDVRLPDGNGIDICQRLRRSGFSKPIIILTAKDAKDDIVRSLEAGANDYITKPLRMGELLARIRAQLSHSKASDDAWFDFGDLSFVAANKMLHHKGLDKMLPLTEKEAMILKFLYRALPEDVSKQKILGEIWGYQNGVSTHTLETHIYRLRQKIARLSERQLVMTTDRGYRLGS